MKTFVYFRFHNDSKDQLRLKIYDNCSTLLAAKKLIKTFKADIYEVFLSNEKGSMQWVYKRGAK